MRQLVRSVSGDNLVFYFSTISWLRLQQETMWVNVNFERRDLFSVQKSHPFPDDFREAFTFKLIKQNVTHFSFILLTQSFLLCPWKIEIQIATPRCCKFLHIVSMVAYQAKVTHQCLPLPASAFSPPWYVALPNSHIENEVIHTSTEKQNWFHTSTEKQS